MGEMKFDMVVESGDTGALTMQAAEVRKPLLAVSSLNKKGNPVWFDGEQSYVIPSTARNLAMVRKLLKEMDNKIPLHLENGVFVMKAWKGPRPFQGRGR